MAGTDFWSNRNVLADYPIKPYQVLHKFGVSITQRVSVSNGCDQREDCYQTWSSATQYW